ncbi:uncharacterized protein N7515_000050 [Penicillium bovifimosum]|uniref:Uncharacterized protein n=1 Tax=Penicillium bovifimosum TaxID=126998 RepID=A0A9W9HER3_9EURO|nr:uncharacterized protein N7515_000050 [Penicillium bovifimosum]KAJ5145486.1 hypothetical protein N7515_000050 [Penicillium bovifimosum]
MLSDKISLLLLATTGTSALWIAAADMTYYNSVSGGIYPSPSCQVGKGETRDEAWSLATSEGTESIALGGILTCDELNYKKTNQLGGFWDDYGTIFYETDDRMWYCGTGGGQGACDAGEGVPK